MWLFKKNHIGQNVYLEKAVWGKRREMNQSVTSVNVMADLLCQTIDTKIVICKNPKKSDRIFSFLSARPFDSIYEWLSEWWERGVRRDWMTTLDWRDRLGCCVVGLMDHCMSVFFGEIWNGGCMICMVWMIFCSHSTSKVQRKLKRCNLYRPFFQRLTD